MRKLCPVLLAIVVMVSLVIGGCTTPSAPSAPESIKIGISVSLTGYDAQLGKPAENGYEMAVEDINREGGVYVKEYDKKMPLELIVMDMESNPEKAIARAEALNAQNVLAVCGNTLLSATSDIYEKNQLPVITSIVTNLGLWQRGFKYWFGIDRQNDLQVDAVLGVFKNLPEGQMPTKWAIWEEQSDWIIELFDITREKAPAQGITFVSDDKYPMLSPDMSPLIMSAKNAGAEAIFSCPNPQDGLTMLKQMKELNYSPKAIVMTRACDDPSWVDMTGPMGDYVVGAPSWHPGLNFPGVNELNDKYKAKFGTVAHVATGPAYASIQVVADAIERAGALDRSKIRDAIAASDMMTVFGQVKFNDRGQRIDSPPVVIQWQSRAMEMVWPDDLKTKPLVYPIP